MVNIVSRNIRTVGSTFSIGFIAGIAPIVFAKVLPTLYSSGDGASDYAESFSFLTGNTALLIILVGSLVGLVSVILFSKGFDQRDPRDVFFYALGIPAVLITTASSLTDEMRIRENVSRASAAIAAEPPIEALSTIPGVQKSHLKVLSSDGNLGHARDERMAPQGQVLVQYLRSVDEPRLEYAVVIGEYETEQAANDALQKLSKQRLSTEKFYPSRMQVKKISGTRYALVYANAGNASEARKAFRLLRLNDPQLNPSIISYPK